MSPTSGTQHELTRVEEESSISSGTESGDGRIEATAPPAWLQEDIAAESAKKQAPRGRSRSDSDEIYSVPYSEKSAPSSRSSLGRLLHDTMDLLHRFSFTSRGSSRNKTAPSSQNSLQSSAASIPAMVNNSMSDLPYNQASAGGLAGHPRYSYPRAFIGESAAQQGMQSADGSMSAGEMAVGRPTSHYNRPRLSSSSSYSQPRPQSMESNGYAAPDPVAFRVPDSTARPNLQKSKSFQAATRRPAWNPGEVPYSISVQKPISKSSSAQSLPEEGQHPQKSRRQAKSLRHFRSSKKRRGKISDIEVASSDLDRGSSSKAAQQKPPLRRSLSDPDKGNGTLKQLMNRSLADQTVYAAAGYDQEVTYSNFNWQKTVGCLNFKSRDCVHQLQPSVKNYSISIIKSWVTVTFFA